MYAKISPGAPACKPTGVYGTFQSSSCNAVCVNLHLKDGLIDWRSQCLHTKTLLKRLHLFAGNLERPADNTEGSQEQGSSQSAKGGQADSNSCVPGPGVWS